MNPSGKNYSLYYAHLDSQIVSSGQQVKAGDVLGLMGNTGNARTTIPHLHFGIYTNSGAVDPLPFIDKNRKSAGNTNLNLENLHEYLRNQSVQNLYSSPDTKSNELMQLPVSTIVRPIAATENYYKVELADGRIGFVQGSSLTANPVGKRKLDQQTRLLDQPNPNAAAKFTLPANAEVSIRGSYGQFNLISYNNLIGWISSK